jgi:hypothetical protein
MHEFSDGISSRIDFEAQLLDRRLALRHSTKKLVDRFGANGSHSQDSQAPNVPEASNDIGDLRGFVIGHVVPHANINGPDSAARGGVRHRLELERRPLVNPNMPARWKLRGWVGPCQERHHMSVGGVDGEIHDSHKRLSDDNNDRN